MTAAAFTLEPAPSSEQTEQFIIRPGDMQCCEISLLVCAWCDGRSIQILYSCKS